MNEQKDKSYLEPRVAKLEVGLDRLTSDVQNLASIVREQGSQMEGEIQKLVVAVTQAAGPRKTDWSTIIAALMLVMAIGSAVFWPLNQTSQNNKDDLLLLRQELSNHKALNLHPVGEVRVNNMEARFTDLSLDNAKNLEALDKKLQRETELITTEIRNQVSTISSKYDREISNLGDRLIGRLNQYDEDEHEKFMKDIEELRSWRLRAMTGDIKSSSTNEK